MRIAIYPCNEIAEFLNRELSVKNSVKVFEEFTPELSGCDYIIIAVKDILHSAAIREELKKEGTHPEKILEYCFFEKDPAKSGAEMLAEKLARVKYDRYICGMSHAYGGILEDMLRGNVCKLAAPSMDLYYHRMVLQHMILIPERIGEVRQIIFELPYYIFNYDVSLCKNIFVQRMNYYHFFSDYHHFGETEEGARQIAMFEKMNSLFPQPVYRMKSEVVPVSRGISVPHKLYRRLRYTMDEKRGHPWTAEELKKIADLRPHVWYQRRPATVEENSFIWRDIMDALEQYPQIDWKVVVFPFAPVFIEEHRDAITGMREEFYDRIQVSSERVIDCFEWYLDRPEYFSDECHLNEKGRFNFSKIFDSLTLAT